MNTKVAISVAALFCLVVVAKVLFGGDADKAVPMIEPTAAVEDVVAVASPSVSQQDSVTTEAVDPIAHNSTEQEGAKNEIKTRGLKEDKANMQKQLTMFGMKFNSEIGALTPAELENDLAEIEKYIENNNVIALLNEEKVAKEDLGKYGQLLDHVVKLRTAVLTHKIEKLRNDTDEAIKDQASKLEMYKQGALYDNKKYGEAAVEQEIRKLKEEFQSKREKQEMEDRALLIEDLGQRSEIEEVSKRLGA